MVRGLYTAYTGMLNEQYRLDIISNNLANASTVGYKEESVTSQAFKDVLSVKIKDASEAYTQRAIGNMNLGVKIGEVYTDFQQGAFRHTENTYELGIEGSGFFNILRTDKNGNESIKYTRDGSFTLTSDGFVVTKDGDKLLGESGPIQIPLTADNITIDETGRITVDKNDIDKIKLTDFEDYDYIKKYGDNLYQTVNGATEKPTTAFIQQGFLEQSNVNSVSEMVEMITITRAFEANQKVMQSIDTTLEKAANQVGRL